MLIRNCKNQRQNNLTNITFAYHQEQLNRSRHLTRRKEEGSYDDEYYQNSIRN
jgi:hypothetical protein